MNDSIVQGAHVISKTIQRALQEDDGALIGRNGSTEIQLMIDGTNQHLIHALRTNAGIFPLVNTTSMDQWRIQSIQATQEADVLVAGWYAPIAQLEQHALRQWNVRATQIPLRSLEPYYVDSADQWIQHLAGHRVSVVSSFTETAKKQSKKLSDIWGSSLSIPDSIEWQWVQTGYVPAVAKGINEWPSPISTWTQAVEYVVATVIQQGSRFALIGCGALGMPIAHKLKQRGIIAIVLGGAIQVLFGIKGRRWETHRILSKFWNSHWVWPSKEETPNEASSIEGGCYWH